MNCLYIIEVILLMWLEYIDCIHCSRPWKKLFLEFSMIDSALDHNEIFLNYDGNDIERLIHAQTHPGVQDLGENIIICFMDSSSILVSDIMLSPLYQNQSEGLKCFTNMGRDWSVGASIPPALLTYAMSPRTGPYLTKGLNIWNVDTTFQIYMSYPGVILVLDSIKPISKVYVFKSRRTGPEFILEDIEVKIGTEPFMQMGPNLSYKRFGYRKGEDNLGSGGIMKFERKAPMFGNYVMIRQRNTGNIPVPTLTYFHVAYIQIQ